MNIALTYFCNQKCKYCFGSDAMLISTVKKEDREITEDNLNRILYFMKRSGIRSFQMIGGEPTLHSKFEDMYNIISDNGLSISIFSNGVIARDRVDFLSKKENLANILLNIRHPSEYSKSAWEKITYTISRLNKKVTLSFRVYELDFDPTFLFDLIDEYQADRLINWAIACPSLVTKNAYIRLEDHEKVVERMVEFSWESKKRNIRWYPDSGFIFCAFSNGKLEKLKENVGFMPLTNCHPPIEVAPNLRVFRCFGLAPKSRPGLKLTDFKNLDEVARYFSRRSLPFKRVGGMDKCFNCEHIKSGRCGGGCMVHILKRFPAHKKPIF